MTDWTAGYVADIGYTFGYYPELNPLWIKLAFLYNGFQPPEIHSACELGFGQGLSINLHAAGSTCSWQGTDFNPGHACFAQNLAAIAGSGATLYDESFAEFCSRQDLPDFDFIGLHGIWSWISQENRAVIVAFIRRKLKVGGVVYISYNTLPGWSAFAPARQLMAEHAKIIGVEGHGIVSRINGALDFTEKLVLTNPAYALANPMIADRITTIKQQNRHYLAHEYFNQDWLPMHFATMAELLEPAKLSYACSAHYHDHINALNHSAEQQTFLNDIADTTFRETVRDFMLNRQFRRDFWVKGGLKLSMLEQHEAIRALKVLLVTPRNAISYTIKTLLSESSMSHEIYDPILTILADHEPKTLEQLERLLSNANLKFGALVEAVVVLMGSGHLALVQESGIINHAKGNTDKLNAYIINKSRGSNDLNYLASPVTGGGFLVNRNQQLFLLALSQGLTQPNEWVKFVWQIFATQGQRIVKEGKTLDSAQENIAELTAQAASFLENQLPILKALLIA